MIRLELSCLFLAGLIVSATSVQAENFRVQRPFQSYRRLDQAVSINKHPVLANEETQSEQTPCSSHSGRIQQSDCCAEGERHTRMSCCSEGAKHCCQKSAIEMTPKEVFKLPDSWGGGGFFEKWEERYAYPTVCPVMLCHGGCDGSAARCLTLFARNGLTSASSGCCNSDASPNREEFQAGKLIGMYGASPQENRPNVKHEHERSDLPACQ